jgi:hypothetical protein
MLKRERISERLNYMALLSADLYAQTDGSYCAVNLLPLAYLTNF